MHINGIDGAGPPSRADPSGVAANTQVTGKANTGAQISDRKHEAYRVTISVEAKARSNQNIEPISVNVKIGDSPLFSVLSSIKKFISLFIGNNSA